MTDETKVDPKQEPYYVKLHDELKATAERLASADHLGVAEKLKDVAEAAAKLHEAYHDGYKYDAVKHVIDSVDHTVHSIVANVHANLTRLAADLPPFEKPVEKPAKKPKAPPVS